MGCTVHRAFTFPNLLPSFNIIKFFFFVLQEELDLTAPNKAAMLSLPPQKKWQIYCSRKGGEDLVDQARAPEHYIERLRTLAIVRLLRPAKIVTV